MPASLQAKESKPTAAQLWIISHLRARILSVLSEGSVVFSIEPQRPQRAQRPAQTRGCSSTHEGRYSTLLILQDVRTVDRPRDGSGKFFRLVVRVV